MKKVLTIICWALWFGTICMPAQTASDLNEGLVISSPVEGQFELSWWGKDGWTYFIEQSEDLIHWHFLPVIETLPSGMGDGVLTWGLCTNAPRSFFKLRMSNISTEDSHSADFDGDGISNWAELENGTDPFDYYNGNLPTLRIVSGGNQWGPVNGVLPEPVAVEVGAGLANAPVVFTSAGAQLSTDGTGNWTSKVIIKSSPSQALVTAQVYVKLPSTPNSISQISASVTTGGVSSQVTTNASTSGDTLLPPTDFFASVLSTTSMRIQWTPTDPTRHTSIEISKDQGATWELLAVVDPGLQSFDVEELESGKKVLFRLFTGDIRTAITVSAATMSAPASLVTALAEWKERVIEIFYGRSMQITAPPAGSSPPTKPFGDGPPLVIENVRWEESRQISAEFGEEQGVGYGLYWSEQPWVNLLDPDESSGGIGRDHVEYEQKFRHAVDTFILFPERGWPPEGFRGYYPPSMYSVFCGPYYYYGQVCGSVAGWTQVRLRSDHVLTLEDGPYSKTYLRATWGGGQLNVTSAETLTIPVGKDRSEPATLDPQWVTPFTFENDNGKFYLTTPTFNEVLIPAEIKWEAKGDWNNVEDNKSPVEYQWTDLPDDVPVGIWMPGKGKRIFPDKPTPTGQVRDRVKLRVKVASIREDKKVFVRVYDVDDPTPSSFAGQVIDENGDVGGDNIGGDEEHDGLFEFISGGSVSSPATGNGSSGRQEWAGCELTLDTNGEAIAEMKVTMQPGDNYRAVVVLKQEDLNGLHVGSLETDRCVTPDGEPVKQLIGGASEMLTVWRKLHLEFDSMEAVSDPKETPDHHTVTANSWSSDGKTLTLNDTNVDVIDDLYQNGYAWVGQQKFRIRSNTSRHTVPSQEGPVIVGSLKLTFKDTSAQSAIAVGTTLRIVDDDDNLLSEFGLPTPLPYDQHHAEIVKAIRPRFVTAYVQVEDANALGLNTDTQIPFELNAAADSSVGLGSVFNNAKNIDDTPEFWAFTVTFGYQPNAIEDYDNDSESPLRGSTPKLRYVGSTFGFTVIYMETVRDRAIGYLEGLRDHLEAPSIQASGKKDYYGYIYGTIAHEVGHGPGSESETSDHAESGLMDSSGPPIETLFSKETIRRFRNVSQWSK